MKIEFEFRRTEDEFCLLSHDEKTKYIINLSNVRMSYKRYNASNLVQKWFDNRINKELAARLPIDRSLMKHYVVSELSIYNQIRGPK